MVERWIDVATSAGLLGASDDKYRTLALTTLGRDVMTGRVQDIQIAAPREKPAPSTRKKSRKTRVDATPSSSAPQQPIVDALRAWRLDEARRNAIAPFVVLHDRTLIAIASELPGSPGELSSIPGIGPAKLASYGDAILNIVKGSR
jgi:superfamily II DNA helicase RecQ